MRLLLSLVLLLATAGLAAADYEPAHVWVICELDPGIEAITAAEFAVANLPAPEVCAVIPIWNTSLVIGELGSDIAMAFDPPLAGPRAVLGHIDFIAFEPLGDDYVMQVVAGQPSDLLVVVDLDFNEIPADGGAHTFNCTSWCGCGGGWPAFIGLYAGEDSYDCFQDIEIFTTPAETSSFGAVKALY